MVLAKVQLRALLASFRVGGSRKKAVSGWTALALMAALCLFISGSYSFPLGGQLAAAGCLELLLLMMSAMAVIAGLMFTAFAAQGVVFGGRDADLLLSMPVSAFSVMLAKLTALYVENLVFCAFLVLPAGAAWLWFGGGGGALFVLRLLIGSFFLAMLPTALSLAAGFLLSWLGGRLANRKAVSLLLYALVLATVFYLAMNVNISMASLAAGTTGAEVEGAFTGWGVPFLLFQRGVCGDWETLVMCCWQYGCSPKITRRCSPGSAATGSARPTAWAASGRRGGGRPCCARRPHGISARPSTYSIPASGSSCW